MSAEAWLEVAEEEIVDPSPTDGVFDEFTAPELKIDNCVLLETWKE